MTNVTILNFSKLFLSDIPDYKITVKAMLRTILVLLLTTTTSLSDVNYDLNPNPRTQIKVNPLLEDVDHKEVRTDDDDGIDSKVSALSFNLELGSKDRSPWSIELENRSIQGSNRNEEGYYRDQRVQIYQRRHFIRFNTCCRELTNFATELAGFGVNIGDKVGEDGVDNYTKCDIGVNKVLFNETGIKGIIDLQTMATNKMKEMIARAEAAAEDVEDTTNSRMNKKDMMQFFAFMEITKQETVTDVNTKITGLETKMTLQMQKDKEDLTKEMDRKNTETRKIINEDVRQQISDMDSKRQKERDEEQVFRSRMEEQEKRRLEEQQEDRRKLAELTDMVTNANSTAQNNFVQQEVLRQKIQNGFDSLHENTQQTYSQAASSISHASLSSGRVMISHDDPRRVEFIDKVEECRRTLELIVGGIAVYNGVDSNGNELAYYLNIFNNEIMQGLYGITGRRATYYLEQMETEGFRWRLPDLEKQTKIPKVNADGKTSPHKFYIRFKNVKSKYDFEDEKRHLNPKADITVISFFPKCFREKYNALNAEGKKWKEIAIKTHGFGQFKVGYANDEDEIYLEVRSRKGGQWSKLTTDLPSLLKMSLAYFKDVNSDGYRKRDESVIERRRQEFRRLNEMRRDLPRVEPSSAVKRSYESMEVTGDLIAKFTKKPKGMSKSKMAALTKKSVPKHKLPNLDDLAENSETTDIRVKHYFSNRNKIIKTLQINNTSSNYVVTRSDRKFVNGMPTNLFNAVTVNVPTALLLVSARRFLKWTENKKIDVGPAEFISLTKSDYSRDKNDLPQEIRMTFVNSRNKANSAHVHIYLTNSRILVQGGSGYEGTTFGVWVWENVLKPAMEDVRTKDPTEINQTSKILAETNLKEQNDGRLKGQGKRVNSVTKSANKGSPRVGASKLVYNFGNIAGPKVSVAQQRKKFEKKCTDKPDAGSDAINKDAQVDVGDNKGEKEKSKKTISNREGDVDVGDNSQDIDRVINEAITTEETSPAVEKSKGDDSDDDWVVVDDEEEEPTQMTPPPAGLRKRLEYSSVEEVYRSDLPREKSDFIADDFTGLKRTIVLELPYDLISRFKYVFETFTTGMAEIQVHLTGYRRMEGETHVVTVTEMVIPQQTGSIHDCHIVDKDFIRNLDAEKHVGVLHVHPEGGCYLSGEDTHTTASFEKSTGGPFVSGVFDPINNCYGFMVIKDTKLEAVHKCRQLSKTYGIEDHSHPEVWAFITVKEIETPVIICDMRGGSRNKDWTMDRSKIFGAFEPTPLIRNLNGDPWTPLSKEAFMSMHNMMKELGLDTLRKPYVGEASAAAAERPLPKMPGDKHWDEKYMEFTMPVEDFIKPDQGMETVKGLLLQKRKQKPRLKRPGIQRTTSEPDIDKMIKDMERLNMVCADLTQANVGLQTELTRMKDSATIFGSTTFESIGDHSILARVLTLFGKVISSGMHSRCENCDWFGKLVNELDINKGKIKDIFQWLKSNIKDENIDDLIDKQTDNQTLTDTDNVIEESGFKSLRDIPLTSELNVLSWNMNGHHKISELIMIIDECNPDLICIQETKLNASSQLNFEMIFADKYYFHSKHCENDVGVCDINLETLEGNGGVMIMWRKELNSKVIKVNNDFASFVAIILDTGLQRTLLISVYAPTFGKNAAFSRHLDNLSDLFNKEEGKFDVIAALGDWNINSKSSEIRKAEMETWCEGRGLIRLDPTKPTHRHFVWGTETFLDCIYTDSDAVQINNTSLSFLTSSDHQPVTVTLKTGTEHRDDGGASQRIVTESYLGNLWKLDRAKIEELNEELSQQFAWIKDLPIEATEARLININKSLVRAHNKVMPRKPFNNKKRGLYGLSKEKQILKTLKLNRGRDKTLVANLNVQLNDIRSRRRFSQQSRIFRKFKECPGDIFKFISKLKGKGPGTPDKIIADGQSFYDSAAHERIVTHYNDLGRFDHPLYNEDAGMNKEWIEKVTKVVNTVMLSKEVQEDKLEPLTLEEFKKVIRSFPKGKASDMDGVSHDMFHHLTDENLTHIMSWINSLFQKDCFLSPELSKSRFSLLYKKGPTTSIGNYRALTVSSVMLRIIERTLMTRGMQQKFEDSLEEAQSGFRKFRSYTMPLLEINEQIRKHRQENSPLFVLSTDVCKAFPRMDPRINLLEMMKRGLSGGELKFSRDTYLGRKSHLKVGGTILSSPRVRSEVGETEGGLTCPGRASCNFDITTKAVNNSSFGVKQKGIEILEAEEDEPELVEITQRIAAKLQADDALYTLSTIYEAASCWKTILAESKFVRAHYNETKCVLLCLNVDQDDMKRIWTEIQEKDGIQLGIVQEISYLGMTLSGHKDADVRNVEAKIGAACGSLRIISGAGLNNQQLCEPRLRITMLYSYVVSKALAGLDSMRLSNAGEEKLRQFGDNILRTSFFLQKHASTHLIYLVAGKVRLNVLWRLGQLNLLLRCLALNGRLAEALRWDFVHETKGSWIYQCVITMEHYKIKDFNKIVLGDVITTANSKEVFKSFKELIIRQEFETTKRKLLGQKWINHFDLSSVRPGKVSRHLLGAKSTQEIRGITMILQFLSNSYLTFSVLSPKIKCVVCKKENDTPNHTWVCEKATIARSLREHLQRQLPMNHPAAKLPVNSRELTYFILDPESSLLERYQLTERPKNFDKIMSLCRLIANFSHQNRARVIKRMKKKELDMWKHVEKRSSAAKRPKNKPAVSFLAL